ncbi:unnamed protein product, partial [marine sediment metagenome]
IKIVKYFGKKFDTLTETIEDKFDEVISAVTPEEPGEAQEEPGEISEEADDELKGLGEVSEEEEGDSPPIPPAPATNDKGEEYSGSRKSKTVKEDEELENLKKELEGKKKRKGS